MCVQEEKAINKATSCELDVCVYLQEPFNLTVYMDVPAKFCRSEFLKQA